MSRPCRLPVENQALSPIAPPGIGNDIKRAERPEGRPLARNPNLEPLL